MPLANLSLAIFRNHRRSGRILFDACHKAAGRMGFARTPDRGAAATILSLVQPIRDNLLDFAPPQSKPVTIAEAVPQGYGLVERTDDSPSFTGRSLVDETPQAPGHAWCESFSHFIRANTEVLRAGAYIDANWNPQPMRQSGGSNGHGGERRVQASACLKETWLSGIDAALGLHGSD